MKCDFSYNHYRTILKKALKQGFVLTNFRDYNKVKSSSKIIILRHDVDSVPNRDFEFAKIEHDLGITSTFFVRVHGQYYHPFREETFKIFQEMMKMGHEIGLHFEARALAPIFKIDSVELFKKEKKILEETLAIKVISAAEHAYLKRPQNFWQNHFFTRVSKRRVGIKNYPQEKKYSAPPKFHYLSDSLGQWREGCLCQNLARYNHLQVLVHGDHWGKNAKQEVKRLIKYDKIQIARNWKI